MIGIADKKDTQSNKYLLTINNPKEKGLTHGEIKKILVNNFKTLEYCAMADEMGKTYHTHIFAYFNSRVRFSTVKKNFPEAHIDVVKGMVSDNINYIRKTGKWKDSEKAETSIPDTFEEYGKRPLDSRQKIMCKVIAVANQKDGVGKTTISVNLGIGLAGEGNRVLLIDGDP